MDVTPGKPRGGKKLTRSPLVNVVWQIRFTSDVSIASGRAALQFGERLGRATKYETTQIGDQGPEATAWKFVPKGSDPTTVTLAPNVVTVETTLYGAWLDGFRAWVEDVVRALAEVLDPGVTTRIGLRYVNALVGPVFERELFASPTDLLQYVEPAVLGLISRPDVAHMVDVMQSRQVLSVDGAKATLQSALVRAETDDFGVVIDVDSYRDGASGFSVDDVLACSDRLQDLGLSVFQASITEEGWHRMGPVDLEGLEA